MILSLFFSRASQIMRGVGQRCSFYHNTHQRPHPAASSASSTSSSNGSGSPPSSVHMGQLGKITIEKKIGNKPWPRAKLICFYLSDSGYTTPSNLTSASVNTQESAISSTDSSGHSSSSASSTPTHGATPAASPNTTPVAQIMGTNYMSETLKSATQVQNNSVPQSYTTMPRHFMNQRVPQVQQVQNEQMSGTLGISPVSLQNQAPSAVQVQHPSAQLAYMGTTGGTLQKVKRIYL